MKTIKTLGIFAVILSMVCTMSTFAAAPVDTSGTWCLWHMDSRTNWTDPPSLPWYIHDDASANPGRTNDLAIAGNNVTAGGSYGSYLDFDGSWRAISVNGWNNSDTFYFECDLKPVNFGIEQRIFEITSAVSIRFNPNSGHTYGRIRFVSYDDTAAINDLFSGWVPSSTISDSWVHVICSIDASGNKLVTMTGATDGTSTQSGINNAYSGDPRAFVGGDRLNGNRMTAGVDELKVSTIPEPALFGALVLGLLAFLRRK